MKPEYVVALVIVWLFFAFLAGPTIRKFFNILSSNIGRQNADKWQWYAESVKNNAVAAHEQHAALLGKLAEIVTALTDPSHPLQIQAVLGQGITKQLDDLGGMFMNASAEIVKAIDGAANHQVYAINEQSTLLKAISLKIDVAPVVAVVKEQTEVLRETQAALLLKIDQQNEQIQKLQALLREHLGQQKKLARAIEGRSDQDEDEEILDQARRIKLDHPEMTLAEAVNRASRINPYRT